MESRLVKRGLVKMMDKNVLKNIEKILEEV